MTLPSEINPLLLGSSGYQISRSVRLRSSATAYFSRTPSSATNQKTWTWSGWVKRGTIGSQGQLICAGGTSNDLTYIGFDSSDRIDILNNIAGATVLRKITTPVYRDPSAWYHIVVSVDTTNATSGNRVLLYVNGVQITAFSTSTDPTLNQNTQIGLNAVHTIGRSSSVSSAYFDGYLAEVNFVDGQALTPSSFGYTDPSTGVWQPKAYSGTYGTNGFYLKFDTVNLNTDITSTATATAPFGGTANNAKVADSVYLTTNTTTGSAIDIVKYDFGARTQVTRFTLGAAYFTGGTTCTWQLQGSNDDSTYDVIATISVTNVSTNYSGNINANYRYYKLRATAFGTNGQAALDSLLMIQDGLGLDSSGMGNNWTPNQISLTAGSTYDSMLDSPTNSPIASNYPTWNPLDFDPGQGTPTTVRALTDGNLNLAYAATTWAGYRSTMAATAGKWYVEMTCTAGGGGYNTTLDALPTSQARSLISAISVAPTAGSDVLAIALNLDAGTWTTYRNNVQVATGSTTAGAEYCFRVTAGNGVNTFTNFGQRPFTYTPPTGYKALNTFNLPTPTILKGNQYFDGTTYTGDGTNPQVIVNSGNFAPDLVWTKNRSASGNNFLADIIRGGGNILLSDTTAAEVGIGGITSLNSNGFNVNGNQNTNTVTYIGWQWRAGGSPSINNSGSITSNVSVNQSSGFSIATFTAPASGSATVGHGLGATPALIIVKARSTTGSWATWHKSLASTTDSYVNLNQVTAAGSSAALWGTGPTSTVIGLGTGSYIANATSVAYCWAEVAGYSKFGKYTGDGSADGPFVYCGFRPRFILIKDITAGTTNWNILDTARDSYNQVVKSLAPNVYGAESTYTSSYGIDVLSNGFKIRLAGSPINTSSDTHIFAAFAENPFNISRAR